MMKINYIWIIVALLGFNAIGMHSPNYQDVFTNTIYEVSGIENEEEIPCKLNEAKLACVHAHKTMTFEQRLKTYQEHNHYCRTVKHICLGLGGVGLLAMAWWGLPAGASFMAWARKIVSDGSKFSVFAFVIANMAPSIVVGQQVGQAEMNMLEDTIRHWTDGVTHESIERSEHAYLKRKWRGLVAQDVARQIEKMLLLSRDKNVHAFAIDDFVLTALRLPTTCKALSITAMPICFVGLSQSNQETIKSMMNAMVTCADAAQTDAQKPAQLRCVHVFIGKVMVHDIAKTIAASFDLPFHDFKPDSTEPDDIYGTNHARDQPKMGELIKAFSLNRENYHNSVLNIDYDYLSSLGVKSPSVLKKIISLDSFHSEYFNVDIDVTKMHIFIVSSGRDESKMQALKTLADEAGLRVTELLVDTVKKQAKM